MNNSPKLVLALSNSTPRHRFPPALVAPVESAPIASNEQCGYENDCSRSEGAESGIIGLQEKDTSTDHDGYNCFPDPICETHDIDGVGCQAFSLRTTATLCFLQRTRIEGILLQKLGYIIQVWCSEFDWTGDGDARRDPMPLQDITNKRRADEGGKEERVWSPRAT
ncbi:hypothetical protein DFJ58DRAFT_847485 [Suillus subalutaceus]|uniref:uncharacterized protein n=1 Tax=Suillus subalutaceus TaxID=48586 RepID=UPI001B882AFE|nr:uncharacterized protein DFJ58DRAFT_847485 [Suillus subalutaceus]KAG1834984.1 hypothetical protein DFJ58DRAFT_847485 [Suillus subalutaceus]